MEQLLYSLLRSAFRVLRLIVFDGEQRETRHCVHPLQLNDWQQNAWSNPRVTMTIRS